MIVFITGASGFIGSRLVEHLLSRGDSEIYALVRNPAKLSWLPDNPALIFSVAIFYPCQTSRRIWR